jgi:Secretion system C-terminal sorting domain
MKKKLIHSLIILLLTLSSNIVCSQPPPTFTLNILLSQPNCLNAGSVTASSQLNIICKYFLSDIASNIIDSNTTGIFTGLAPATYLVSGRECITGQLSVPNQFDIQQPAPIIVSSANISINNATNGTNGFVQFSNNYFGYGATQYIYNILTPAVKIYGGNAFDLSFSNLAPGNYVLHQEYPTFNCGVNNQAFVIGGAPLAIIDGQKNNSTFLNISPNPAKNYFTINVDLKILAIELIGFDGKILQSWQPNTTNSYALTNIPTGIYCIKILADNTTMIQKVIVE